MAQQHDLEVLRKELAIATINLVAAANEVQMAVIETHNPVTPAMVERWKEAVKRQKDTEKLYHAVLDRLTQALA